MNKIAFPLVLALFSPFYRAVPDLSPGPQQQTSVGRPVTSPASHVVPSPAAAIRVPQSVAARRLILLLPDDGGANDAATFAILDKSAGGNPTADAHDRTGIRKTPTKTLTQAQSEEARLATATARQQFANSVFAASLVDLLPERLDVTVIAPEEVARILATLRLTRAEAAAPEGARRLCEALNADALLSPQITGLDQRDGVQREIVLRGRVVVWRRNGGEEADTGQHTPLSVSPLPARSGRRGKKRKRPAPPAPDKSMTGKAVTGKGVTGAGSKAKPRPAINPPTTMPTITLPDSVEVSGSAVSDRMPLRLLYMKTESRLLREAAAQTALLAAHTIQTGDVAPFQEPDDCLAVAPIAAPTQGDKLVFASGGRRVVTVPLRLALPDFAAFFAPDLLPLRPPKSVVGADVVQAALRRMGVQSRALWQRDGGTNADLSQRVGQHLGADYLLLARITQVEIDADAPDTPEDERAVRVEIAGALVQTGNGSVLWEERGEATLTARAVRHSATPPDSDSTLASQTARFALADLRRRFHAYRARFLR